jgi:O-antigen ligase
MTDMTDHVTDRIFEERGWLDAVRGLALFLFSLANLQDIVPSLLPASLAFVALAYLPDLRLYRRANVEFAVSAAFVIYIVGLLFMNRNFADGTAAHLVTKSPRLVYVFGVAAVFSCIGPTTRLEPHLVRGALMAGAIVAAASLYSFFVTPLSLGGTPLSGPESVTGLLGSKNSAASCFALIFVFVVAAWLHQYEGALPRCLRRYDLALMAVIFFGFAMCKARGWLIGMAPMFAIVALRVARRDPRRVGSIVLATLALAGGCTVAVLARDSAQAEKNVSTRGKLWARAADYIVRSPIFGIGPGTFEQQHVHLQVVTPQVISLRRSGRIVEHPDWDDPNGGAHPHNSYLQTLVEFGLIGGLLYLALLGQIVRRARYVNRLRGFVSGRRELIWQHARFHVLALLLMLVMLFAAALTEGYAFIGPTQLIYIAASAGRLVALTECLREETARDFQQSANY